MATEQNPFSVYEITQIIEGKLSEDANLQNGLVIGEITDFTRHSSGHIYFNLADKLAENPRKKAVLKCTFFKNQNKSLNFKPVKGMEVIVSGQISLYYQGGNYNFNVRKMMEVGSGNLLLKIQKLREALVKEKIIDPTNKKDLPVIPKRVGIVTGLGTAAFRDILKQVHDRFANADILVAPARVQGDAAANSIAAALEEISKPKWACDVIIVSRGGGSPEDLMAFNEEVVARAIFACKIPVVSGVGHQIDHPISDDVADYAAATPTDAAKVVFPEIEKLQEKVASVGVRLDSLLEKKLLQYREKLNFFNQKSYFIDPYELLQEHYLTLDDFFYRMTDSYKTIVQENKDKLSQVGDLNLTFQMTFDAKKSRFNSAQERLSAYSPLATLKRGFSISYQDNKILTSIKDINFKKNIKLQLSDGSLQVKPLRS